MALGLIAIVFLTLAGVSAIANNAASSGALLSTALVFQILGGSVFAVGLWGLVACYLNDAPTTLQDMLPSIALVLAGSIPLGSAWASVFALGLLGATQLYLGGRIPPHDDQDAQHADTDGRALRARR